MASWIRRAGDAEAPDTVNDRAATASWASSTRRTASANPRPASLATAAGSFAAGADAISPEASRTARSECVTRAPLVAGHDQRDPVHRVGSLGQPCVYPFPDRLTDSLPVSLGELGDAP